MKRTSPLEFGILDGELQPSQCQAVLAPDVRKLENVQCRRGLLRVELGLWNTIGDFATLARLKVIGGVRSVLQVREQTRDLLDQGDHPLRLQPKHGLEAPAKGHSSPRGSSGIGELQFGGTARPNDLPDRQVDVPPGT